jgi:hypothetical protein
MSGVTKGVTFAAQPHGVILQLNVPNPGLQVVRTEPFGSALTDRA